MFCIAMTLFYEKTKEWAVSEAFEGETGWKNNRRIPEQRLEPSHRFCRSATGSEINHYILFEKRRIKEWIRQASGNRFHNQRNPLYIHYY
jgi:hypothetical protein